MINFEANFSQKRVYSIWDDIRTYLSSQIDPKEKSALIAAIYYFKKEGGLAMIWFGYSKRATQSD